MARKLKEGTQNYQIVQCLEDGVPKTIKEIEKLSGIWGPSVQSAITNLLRMEYVVRTPQVKGALKYGLKKHEPMVAKVREVLPPLLLINRIDRLKVMKKRLIPDHHHLLNDIMGDYETLLLTCDAQPELLGKEDESLH